MLEMFDGIVAPDSLKNNNKHHKAIKLMIELARSSVLKDGHRWE